MARDGRAQGGGADDRDGHDDDHDDHDRHDGSADDHRAPRDHRPAAVAPPVAMSWLGAGAFVADTRAVDPTWLGRQMRANGFTWLAVKVHDGLTETELEPNWIVRFRLASGLAVGGWGVLRTDPEQEARLAARLGDAHTLAFYIADAEAEYKYTHGDGTSPDRLGRSTRFVATFRALRPELPAGLSSYCRADTQDLDWQAWSDAGFQFLPQAYVNAQGQASAPAACANAAKRFFPPEAIHPTVGSYAAKAADPSPSDYAAMLDAAGTTGFSIYLAETEMPDQAWDAYGRAISALGIARLPES